MKYLSTKIQTNNAPIVGWIMIYFSVAHTSIRNLTQSSWFYSCQFFWCNSKVLKTYVGIEPTSFVRKCTLLYPFELIGPKTIYSRGNKANQLKSLLHFSNYHETLHIWISHQGSTAEQILLSGKKKVIISFWSDRLRQEFMVTYWPEHKSHYSITPLET